jgi:hypothetical protein
VNAKPSDGNPSSPIAIDDLDVDVKPEFDVEADLSEFISVTTGLVCL